MKIGNDLLKEITVKENVTLHPNDIWESKVLSQACRPGEKFYVLLEGETNATVSPEAKTAAASQEYAEHTAALALCSGNLAMAVMGNLFLKVNKPKVPTRFFMN